MTTEKYKISDNQIPLAHYQTRMHRWDYRGDTANLRPLTVPCNQIPQHLQVDTIAIDGNWLWHSCQFVRLRLFYSKLWSYAIANWCFSSANILSVTTLTQLNSAVCLEHPILRNNSFLCSNGHRWKGGGGQSSSSFTPTVVASSLYVLLVGHKKGITQH